MNSKKIIYYLKIFSCIVILNSFQDRAYGMSSAPTGKSDQSEAQAGTVQTDTEKKEISKSRLAYKKLIGILATDFAHYNEHLGLAESAEAIILVVVESRKTLETIKEYFESKDEERVMSDCDKRKIICKLLFHYTEAFLALDNNKKIAQLPSSELSLLRRHPQITETAALFDTITKLSPGLQQLSQRALQIAQASAKLTKQPTGQPTAYSALNEEEELNRALRLSLGESDCTQDGDDNEPKEPLVPSTRQGGGFAAAAGQTSGGTEFGRDLENNVPTNKEKKELSPLEKAAQVGDIGALIMLVEEADIDELQAALYIARASNQEVAIDCLSESIRSKEASNGKKAKIPGDQKSLKADKKAKNNQDGDDDTV